VIVAAWRDPTLSNVGAVGADGPQTPSAPARARYGNVDPDGQICDLSDSLLARLRAAICPFRSAEVSAESQLDLALLALAGRLEEARA